MRYLRKVQLSDADYMTLPNIRKHFYRNLVLSDHNNILRSKIELDESIVLAIFLGEAFLLQSLI